MKAVLSATEAAYYLGCTERALYDMVDEGQIPFRKRGKKLVFVIKHLDAWLELLPGMDVQEALRAFHRVEHMVDTPSPNPAHLSESPRTSAEHMQLKRRPAGAKYPRALPVD